MPGTPKRTGPTLLTTSVANILQGGGGSALIYDVVTHIHVANKTGNAAKVTAYIGATGGTTSGTELFPTKIVAANDIMDYYCRTPMKSTDFLTMLSDTATALIVTIDSEQYVVP